MQINFALMSDGAPYVRYMSKRLKFALEFKKRNGFIPDEGELDRMVPIPKVLKMRDIEGAREAAHRQRDKLKAVAYGICGVSFFRGRWVGRVEIGRNRENKSFGSCVEAAAWRNEIEIRLRGVHAVLCCHHAAQLVDSGIISWDHVIALKRGHEMPIEYITQKLKEMKKDECMPVLLPSVE